MEDPCDCAAVGLAAAGGPCTVCRVPSMAEAVAGAIRLTPPGGVVLLSPAAPSYGDYRDFSERGRDFAEKSGFALPEEESGR